jgi:phenylacetic acid degradation operon negative regulatory protein
MSSTSRARSRAQSSVRPQDFTLTLIGTHLRPRTRPIWSGGMVELLGAFGFSTGAARVALSRLVRGGWLDRVMEGRLSYYKLTPRTEELLAEGDRRIFSLGRPFAWDGTWTILWHSIPDARRVERSRLGRRLRFLGFGSVQDGAWISPRNREDDVAKLVDDIGVAQYVGVLLGRPAHALPVDELVSRAWNVDELVGRYEQFLIEFDQYRTKRARSRLDDRAAFIVRTRLVHEFRAFALIDPDLPDELMPRAGPRKAAAELFHTIYEGLAEAAQRHFDAVTSGPPGIEPLRPPAKR